MTAEKLLDPQKDPVYIFTYVSVDEDKTPHTDVQVFPTETDADRYRLQLMTEPERYLSLDPIPVETHDSIIKHLENNEPSGAWRVFETYCAALPSPVLVEFTICNFTQPENP